MKNLLYLITLVCLNRGIHTQEVPWGIAYIQTALVGSLLLLRKNTNLADANAIPYINLHVNGFANRLLSNTDHFNRMISIGKPINGIDYSANSQIMRPMFVDVTLTALHQNTNCFGQVKSCK